MIPRFSYPVEVQLLNYASTAENTFNDNTANSILSPVNQSDIVVITHIETFFESIYQTSPSGRPIVSQADASLLQMTFKVHQDDRIFQNPYLNFCKFLNYGEMVEIEPTPINLVKSYIQVNSPYIAAGQSAYVNFWYDIYSPKDWDALKAAIRADKLKYGHYSGKKMH